MQEIAKEIKICLAMTTIKQFINANNLKQVELARYLSIGESFMSQLVRGTRPLPRNLLQMLLENDRGWDVSMFAQEGKQVSVGDNATGVIVNGNNSNSPIDNRHYYSDSPDVLRAQIDLLEERIQEKEERLKEKDAQIKEKDAQIKEKDAQIKEKDAQIKQLLDIIQGMKK